MSRRYKKPPVQIIQDTSYEDMLRRFFDMYRWQPITPEVMRRLERTGQYVLVAGDSGYITTPYRVEVCRYDPEYRPLSPWVNHADDCFEDGGPAPTMYMPLPLGWKEEDIDL